MCFVNTPLPPRSFAFAAIFVKPEESMTGLLFWLIHHRSELTIMGRKTWVAMRIANLPRTEIILSSLGPRKTQER